MFVALHGQTTRSSYFSSENVIDLRKDLFRLNEYRSYMTMNHRSSFHCH